MNKAQILEKLREYSDFTKTFAKNGLLEPEELEVLKQAGLI